MQPRIAIVRATMRRGAASARDATSGHLVPNSAVPRRDDPKFALRAMPRPRSKNPSRNPARRARMSISVTMPTTTICRQRFHPNNDRAALLRRIVLRRRIDHHETIRRRAIATTPAALRSPAEANRAANQLAPSQAVPNLAPRDVRSRVLNASHQRSATNLQPAHRAMLATIVPTTAIVSDRHVKTVLPNRNSPALLARKHLAPNVQLAPSVLQQYRARSASISLRVSAVPSPLLKNQRADRPQASQLANPRKNSPRPRRVPRSLRSPV